MSPESNQPAAAPRFRGRIHWRDVSVLYRREVRSALRERNIVINSILLPIVLYPVILWATYTGFMFVRGQTEGFVSRVSVATWPAGHETLHDRFAANKDVQLADAPTGSDEAATLIKAGRLDAHVEFLPPEAAVGALAENFRVRVTVDESKERSTGARQRIGAMIERYREEWLQREALARGASAADWQLFTVTAENVASGQQMGTFILSRLLPMFFVIMVAMGCFHPAVDATAGERERRTWETLMTTSASRVSIITAKYLYVTTFGGLAGLLNLAAMTASMKPILAPMLEGAGQSMSFAMPLSALPLLALATVLLAGFVAAGMMILASFARTFKEGQSMITPFYLLIMLPVIFLQSPGLEFTWQLACIPVVNVVMLVRTVVLGEFPAGLIVVTLAVSLVVIAACIRLATYIMQFEDVMLGSYSGNFHRFVRERVFRRKPSVRAVSAASS